MKDKDNVRRTRQRLVPTLVAGVGAWVLLGLIWWGLERASAQPGTSVFGGNNSGTGGTSGISGITAGSGISVSGTTNITIVNTGLTNPIPDNVQLQFGQTNGNSGYIANSPNHGPGAGQGELGIQGQRRLSTIWGTALQQNDDWQIGANLQLNYPGGNEIYINPDYKPTNNVTPLGYSILTKWYANAWGGGATILFTNAIRFEATDTNSHTALRFYNTVGNEHPLNGQSPGGIGYEITDNGEVHHGRQTFDLLPVLLTGTNFGVSFDGSNNVELQPVTALNLTNVTGFAVRASQSTTVSLKVIAGTANHALASPATWLWGNSGGNGTAPTNVPASNVMVISITQDIGALTNYYATYQLYPYAAAFDPDAQTFITAAGLTDGTQKFAVNYSVLAMKNSNIWTKTVGAWPMIGGTFNTCKVDLKATHNLAQIGTVTYNTKGATGDWNGASSTGALDTGIAVSSLTSAQNNLVLGFCVAATNSSLAATTGFFAGANAGGILAEFRQTSGVTMNIRGFNNADNGVSLLGTSPSGNWLGMWIVNRNNATRQTVYQNYSNSTTPTTGATTGTATSTIYFLDSDFSGGVSGAGTQVTENWGIIGQGYTDTDVQSANSIITTCNQILGR